MKRWTNGLPGATKRLGAKTHIALNRSRGSRLVEALAVKWHHPAGWVSTAWRAAQLVAHLPHPTPITVIFRPVPSRINVARAARLRNMWGVAGRGREPYATAKGVTMK